MPALLSKDRVPDLTFAFSTQVIKYLLFNNPNWDHSNYHFSSFEKDTRLAASFLNATNPGQVTFCLRLGQAGRFPLATRVCGCQEWTPVNARLSD